MRYAGCYYVTLLNRELVSRVKYCLVSVFPDIVKDCPEMRNLPKIFLRSFENVGPDVVYCTHSVILSTPSLYGTKCVCISAIAYQK